MNQSELKEYSLILQIIILVKYIIKYTSVQTILLLKKIIDFI